MTQVRMTPEVKFCYQCGRRLDPQKSQCWYCGTEKRPYVRPPKNCQFCGGVVPYGAVKCSHCGEFLDGRQKPQPVPQQPAQQIFVIDGRYLQGGGNLQLPGGANVPPAIEKLLDPQTVRAIEDNRPEMVSHPGVRLLAGPGEVVDVEVNVHSVAGEPGGGRRQLGGPQAPAVRGSGGAQPPMRREDAPDSIAKKLGIGLGNALVAFGRWVLIGKPRARKTGAGDALDAREEERYRICEHCSSENLASDNFCFHCGVQYHRTEAEAARGKIAPAYHPSNAAHFTFIGLVLVFLVWNALSRLGISEYLPNTIGEMIAPALAALAALFALGAFFRRRTSGSQIASIILLAAVVAVYVMLYIWGMFGSNAV